MTPSPVAACRAALSSALALLLALAALLVVAGSPWAPQALAEETSGVAVRITTQNIVSGGPDDTLVVSGTVTNTSGRGLGSVQVHLWRSTDVVSGPEVLDEVLASSPDNPLGRRMLDLEQGNVFNVTDAGGRPSQAFPGSPATPHHRMAPGEQARFTVRAKVSTLGFGTPGAYLTGVQVRGAPEGGQNQTLGRARSLFVLAPAAPSPSPATPKPSATAPSTPAPPTPAPVDHGPVATVVLLNSRPSMLEEGVFADDHLASELGGRLSRLLQLARQPGTTILLDPALVDALESMAHGYRVRGSTAPTTRGQQAAKDFLAALRPLVREGRALRTLYGSPDVAAAVATGHADLLRSAASTVPAGHLLAGLPLAVVPAEGIVDVRTLAALASLRPAAVLISSTTSTAPVQRWQASDGTPLTLVRVRPELFDGGPAPTPADSPAQVAGRLQAEQATTSAGVVSLVQTAAQASAELAPARWRTRTPLARLLADAPARPATLQPASPATPDPAWQGQLDSGAGDLAAWAEMVQGPEARVRAERVLPQALSTAWQGNSRAAADWMAAERAQRGSVLTGDKVSLHVVGEFVTSSAEQEIPVTISNELTDPVRVRIHFTSENAQRIDVADTPVLLVDAGDSETVKVKVSAHANGEVGVTARLVTPQGRPIGTARPLTITATSAGRVGWIIIIASGAVFLAGTAMRVRQVQRERRGSTNVGQKASQDEVAQQRTMGT